MIYIDTSELKSSSKTAKYLPEVYTPVDGLEKWTGGDVMISVAKLPAPKTKKMYQLHVKKGALIVQIKHGHDLSSSVGLRMNESLHAMHNIGCKQGQAILLFCGFMDMDDEGVVKIDNHIERSGGSKHWMQVQSAVSYWTKRGGVYLDIGRSKFLPQWLNLQEAQLNKIKNDGEKVFAPEKPVMYAGGNDFDPLQPMRKIDDFRIALLTVPRLGIKRVDNLYQWMATRGEPLTLRSAIHLLVTEHKVIVKEVPMWGVGTIEQVWKWYDMESNFITVQAFNEGE